MSNRYIKTLSDKTDIDIRKINRVTGVEPYPCGINGLPLGYGFKVYIAGDKIPISFDTEEEAKKERMRLIEMWYSIAAEDAMNSGILHYETRGE